MTRDPERVRRRARWGFALVLATVPAVYGTGMLLVAARPIAQAGEAGTNAIRVIGGLGVAFAGVVLVAGFVQLVRAAAAFGRPAAIATTGAAVGALAMAVAMVGSMSGIVPSSGLGGVLGIAGAAGVVVFLAGATVVLVIWSAAPREATPSREPWTGSPRFATSRARGFAGVAAFAGLLVVICLGLAEALVWGPLAQVPGTSLEELYAGLSRGGVRYGVSFIVVWVVCWLLAAVVLLTLCLWPSSARGSLNRLLTPRRVLLAALAIGSLATFWQGWSTFSLGMSIADTLPPYSGGRSVFWGMYTALGQAAFVAVILRVFIPGPAGDGSRGGMAPAAAASA